MKLFSNEHVSYEAVMRKLSLCVALIGGMVLIALILLISASVTGRAFVGFGFTSIRGDYELVEAGVAFAVFCFLPITVLYDAHAQVTVFTDYFPQRINRLFVIVSRALMLIVTSFILWRHILGTLDKFKYGDTTVFLGMPLWWTYAACIPAGVVAVIVCAYVLVKGPIKQSLLGSGL